MLLAYQRRYITIEINSVVKHNTSVFFSMHATYLVHLILVVTYCENFYVLLTMHLSIILVINQLDAQNLVL